MAVIWHLKKIVFWHFYFSTFLQIFSQWFGRSIIKSCVKFSYDHAQSFIDKPDRDFDSSDDKASVDEYPPISDGYSLNTVKSKVLQLHQVMYFLGNIKTCFWKTWKLWAKAKKSFESLKDFLGNLWKCYLVLTICLWNKKLG